MFEKVQTLIERGDLKKALKALRSFSKLQQLPPKELLIYFQLSRRVGDFQFGALQLEKLGVLFPELEVEMAFFLGELGAVNQAIRLLKLHPGTLSLDIEIQRHLQLGNFLSLLHRYDEAIAAYAQMQTLAKDHKPVLECVGRLNVLGHSIYQGTDLQENMRALQDFKKEKLHQYPLMNQGASYFIALAYHKLQDEKKALQSLDEAFSIGVEHRMRESLLLDLTRFQLQPASFSKSEVSGLKKRIESQVHIVYMDQFYKIMGQRAELEGATDAALRHYQRVIYGGRPHEHFHQAKAHWQKLSGINDEIPGWQIERNLASPLTRKQIIYNQFEKKDWPLLQNAKDELKLSSQSPLLRDLTLNLSKNLGFPVRDAETWEHVWNTPFSFVSSPTVLRTLMSRFRKSPIAQHAEIFQEERRLRLSLRQGSKLFTPL